uniref:Uncharacterized protein n=1 Tax=Myoviridae sp. ct0e511 TaxID=2825013 RepID=A0A8S5QKA8_9CAUD|nr:MAG TPA: hypothetical protein [Myoviridae sp. ct0e511]
METIKAVVYGAIEVRREMCLRLCSVSLRVRAGVPCFCHDNKAIK